jgi:hypothetical protein
VEEVAEEEEEEDTGSPDLGWAHNEEEDQEEGHGKSGDTPGDTESVGSETVLNEPPPRQATFLSSGGFGTQALMETQESRFTDRRMPPEGHDLLPRNSSELEAEWHQTSSGNGGGWHDGGVVVDGSSIKRIGPSS